MAIVAYTDGSSLGNPGPGGYGLILLETEKMVKKEISQGFRLTTNNRMELMAVVVALSKLKDEGHDVHIYTDSKYVSDAINQNWIAGWVKRAWKNVKNPDLWQTLIPLLKKYNPKFHWIKGHAGHPENELVDQLAVKAAQNANLQVDNYFENQNKGGLF